MTDSGTVWASATRAVCFAAWNPVSSNETVIREISYALPNSSREMRAVRKARRTGGRRTAPAST